MYMKQYVDFEKNNIASFLNTDNLSWLPKQFGALQAINQPSNQIMVKNEDGSLSGVRYHVRAENRQFRSIKSWTIHIEKWACQSLANITAKDVMFIRFSKHNSNDIVSYRDIVQNIWINDVAIKVDNNSAFNAVMASILFISKIDANRMPDIDKTLNAYNLNN